MAQNNTNGLLVDVDIESFSSTSVSREQEMKTNSDSKILTLSGGEDEVNSNLASSTSANIFDAIESVSSYPAPGDGEGRQRERINSVDSTNSIRSYDSTGVESAHSGEALLPDVSYNSSSGPGRTPKQKKSRRGENTPLIRGPRSSRNRSEYEDLDDEAFNNWPSKLEVYFLSQHF